MDGAGWISIITSSSKLLQKSNVLHANAESSACILNKEQYPQETLNPLRMFVSDNFSDSALFFSFFFLPPKTYKVTQGCRDPIYESLGLSQCHLEPSWTLWQSGVVQQHSSSSCGQEPLTPEQTEGNEKRLQQPMAPYFICWKTWLILQLCGHCLWMQTIWLQKCRAGEKKELARWSCSRCDGFVLRNSSAGDLAVARF